MFSRLALPSPSNTWLPIDDPLTLSSISIIRATLDRQAPLSRGEPISSNPLAPEAAVLVPLCNVKGKPGILFEVRGKLRSHSGEVSFPGGKCDETDESLVGTALRETDEEIGVPKRQIDILGSFGPPELSLRGLRVYPFVGFVYPSDDRPDDRSKDALPSLSLSSLRANPPEVSHIFHLTFRELLMHDRLRLHEFRGYTPYWAIDVTDKVKGMGLEWEKWGGEDEVGGSGKPGGKGLEVWGLTGWYTNVFMRRLGLY